MPTLREIADRLAQAGHLATRGKPYAPSLGARMLRTWPAAATEGRERPHAFVTRA